MTRSIIVGITGASGGPYARRLLQELVRREVHVHLVISPHGKRVCADELGLSAVDGASLVGAATDRITAHPHNDVGSVIASGSFITDGMVICPCTASTMGAIASGIGENLLHRAAQVTLKEARRLVLVYREMPMSRIDLDNALKLSSAGAIICPANPGFYMQPQSIDDIVEFVVGKVLDVLGVEHDLNTRWEAQAMAQGPAGDGGQR